MNSVFKEEYYTIDYSNNLSDTPLTEVFAEPIADDTFFVNGHTAHVKATTKKGYFAKFVAGLVEGDILEVECEVRNISGVKAKIGIDESSGLTLVSGRTNVLIKQSEGNGEWEALKVKYIVINKHQKVAHAINFGTFGGDVSEFYIRKPRVKAYKQIGSDTFDIERKVSDESIVTKYPDGVMDIAIKKTFSDVSITNSWGSVFTSQNFNLGGWGATFTKSPIVTITAISDNSSAMVPMSVTNATTTMPPVVGLMRGTKTGSPIPNVTFHVTAVGRWK